MSVEAFRTCFTPEEKEHLKNKVNSPNARIVIGQALVSFFDNSISSTIIVMPHPTDPHGIILAGCVPTKEYINTFSEALKDLNIFTIYVDRSVKEIDFKVVDITPKEEAHG